MIQIKDMEMPKRCAECKICINQKTNDYGTYGRCLLQNKDVDCLRWSRDTNCQLSESEGAVTNGDVIKAMFPDVEVKERNNGYQVYFGIGTAIQYFNHMWWNAPYKSGGDNSE